MNNWRYKLFQFMQGRYGFDEFGRFLIIASMIVILLSNFIRFRFIYLVGIALLVYTYFRIMSRNIQKRQQENFKFLNLKSKFTRNKNNSSVKNWNRGANNGPDIKNNNLQYNFYRCRNCGQTIRVPKGRGTLKITCPNCGNSFIDQT